MIRIKKAKTKPISGELRELINKRNEMIKKKNDGEREPVCSECEYSCIYTDEVSKHIERKHVMKGSFECRNCGKEIKSETFLKNKMIFDRKIAQVENRIAEREAKEKRDQIMEQFSYFSENPEKIELQKMWKSLKAICPKLKPTLPCAKRNLKGNIISSQKDIKNLMAAEYKNRLRTRPIRNDLKHVLNRRKDIFDIKMKLSKMRKTQNWTEKDLEIALGDLKNKKSRDYEGYANEIFKNGIIGSDLKQSLLIMFNNLKKESKFLNL